MQVIHDAKKRKQRRIREKIKRISKRLRLSVFRSNKHIYAQIIDDQEEKTLVSASDFDLKNKDLKKKEEAFEVGKLLAEKALDKKIKKVVFDKGAYKYHGRVKNLADGARKGGLEF